jgi:hypothetical protein
MRPLFSGSAPLAERYPAALRPESRTFLRRHLVGERPGHNVTSAHLQAAYPFLAEGGLGAPGVYIGRDPYGGSWVYDPWALYEHGVLGDQNMLVLGKINYRKSTFVKTYLLRQMVFGRQAWVLDVKGEYAALARAVGVEPIRLSPGSGVRLNPLSPRGERESQLSLLRSVAGAALRRELSPEEDAGLRVALDFVVASYSGGEPTLPEVVDALLHPRAEMVEAVSAKSEEDFAEANRESALALQRLCEGDLRGMFDGPTSAGLDLDAPLVVLDLSALRDSAALGILMTCAAAWQQAIMLERQAAAEAGGGPGLKLIFVVEEGWRVMSHIGIAEWLQENFKLCRTRGVQNIIVVHRLTDLGASGSAGSREAKIAEGLTADAGTIVALAQSADQRDYLIEVGFGSTEVDLLVSALPGEMVIRVGGASQLVNQDLSAWERRIVRTDARLVADRSAVLG